jgi:hypothetical protein
MREGAAAADWVSKHYSMPRSGFRGLRILLDCIHGLLMGVAGDAIGLSSIKIGDPASSKGT